MEKVLKPPFWYPVSKDWCFNDQWSNQFFPCNAVHYCLLPMQVFPVWLKLYNVWCKSQGKILLRHLEQSLSNFSITL